MMFRHALRSILPSCKSVKTRYLNMQSYDKTKSFQVAINNSNTTALNILIVGFGVVGKGVLVGLQNHFRNVNGTILDLSDDVITNGRYTITNEFTNPTNKWDFQKIHVDSSNYIDILQKYTTSGTIVIETCVEVNTTDVLKWCLRNNRHFTNTVCDMWKEQTMLKTNHYKNIHGILRDYVLPVAKFIRDENGAAKNNEPTCLIGNGANIGMVNHYFKKALVDASKAWNMSPDEVAEQLKGVYVFEKDTIAFRRGFIPENNVFYNTWNILEFHLESVAHVDYPPTMDTEDLLKLPNNTNLDTVSNVWYKQAMVRDIRLSDTLVHGRVVSHEETYSIADYCLRKYKKHPEVQFIYECSPIGEVSRVKIPLGTPYTSRCVSTEADQEYGSDLVGTLIQLKNGKAWSTYFDCTQKELNSSIKKFTNATAWYVSCGVLASILFLREFPRQGAGFAEDFSTDYNEVVIRNFECFVTEDKAKTVVSKDESQMLSITEAYPTYECENKY